MSIDAQPAATGRGVAGGRDGGIALSDSGWISGAAGGRGEGAGAVFIAGRIQGAVSGTNSTVMGENPSTPPPPRQLEYGSDGVDGRKSTAVSRLVLVLVWFLGLVSWAVWAWIMIYVFVRFLI